MRKYIFFHFYVKLNEKQVLHVILLKHFKKRPLTYKKYSEETNKLTPNTNPTCATHSHQIYYEFLSEHGFFGIVFIIILVSLYLKKFSYFKKNNNLYILGGIIYFIYIFIPLVPSGSFFTSFNATLFWINFCFMYSEINYNDLNSS